MLFNPVRFDGRQSNSTVNHGHDISRIIKVKSAEQSLSKNHAREDVGGAIAGGGCRHVEGCFHFPKRRIRRRFGTFTGSITPADILVGTLTKSAVQKERYEACC